MSESSPESSPERSDVPGDKDAAQAKSSTSKRSRPKQSFDHLPHVSSPSISPAGDDAAKDDALKDDVLKDEPAKAEAATGEQPAATDAETPAQDATSEKVIAFPRLRLPKFKTSRRFKRAAANAATIAVAAGIGALASALAINGLASGVPKQNAVSIAERQAMQTSIAVLAKDVSALKSSVDTANKSSQSQTAKTVARIDSTKRDNDIVTGSISAPASSLPDTIAAATVATITAPLPLPPRRPQIVQGWSVHLSPEGFVLAEQRGGDLFQVAPGMPLPGLGRVEAINRDGGRIEVVTTKGVITSPRRSVRNRAYRFPPYFEPY